jgi:hypothetical protein
MTLPKFIESTKKRDECEAKVEKRHREAVEQSGGRLFKWVCPGETGVPDRLLLLPVAAEHREIVGKYFRLIEFKQKGKGLRTKQKIVVQQLRDMGFIVEVVDQ